MKEVSFIIPAYNAAETIGNTINSIVKAVMLEPSLYEIIVVDDCSTDKTVQIVNSYKDKIPNISLYRLSVNSRQGAARNRGIEVAEGRYVMFVDSDDILLDGFNDALDYARKNAADICLCPIFCEGENELWRLDSDTDFVEDGYKFCEERFSAENKILLTPCSGLYRLRFIKDVKYPFIEKHQAEDTDFVLKHIASAETICYCSSTIYYYSNNLKSTVNRRDLSLVTDYLLMAERIISIAESVSDTLHSFSNVLKCKVVPISVNRLSLWYIGKLRIKDIVSFYEYFPFERRKIICSSGVCGFSAIVLKHKWLSFGCVFMYKIFLAIFKHKRNNG